MIISFKNIHEALRSAALSTAVAAAAGALCAATWVCGGAPWYVAVALPALLAMWQGWRRGAVILGCAALVALSAALQQRLGADFGTRPLHGTAVIRAEDSGVSALPGLESTRRTFPARLLSFTADDGTILDGAAGGRVKAVLPEGTHTPFFGTVARVSGRLIPPDRADAPGPPAALFVAEKFTVVGYSPSWRSRFLELRDRMLRKLFSGVRDAETRQLAAALFCGVVSGVPYEVRDRFSAAGMVHIFSVSGMHVAVLALSLGILLRVLPFKVRWPVLAAAVWGYVLVTGAGTPAVRAGVMVSLWCILRMSLLKLPGFDILSWTLTLLLVADPFLAASPGPQYSFLVTGALLLLGSARERRRNRSVGESDYLPVAFRRRSALNSRSFAAQTRYFFYGALTAFFAAAAVSIRLPWARLAPGAIFANMLLGFMMPGYFALFFVQLLTGLCGLGNATAPLFTAAFRVLRHVAEVTAGVSPALVGPTPPWVSAAAYALALLVFLGTKNRRVRMSAAAVAMLCVAWWFVAAHSATPAVLVVSTGYNRAATVAVADPGCARAVLVNCPDRDSAQLAAEFFRAHGIAEVDVLADAGGVRGARYLNLTVRRVRAHRRSATPLRNAAAKGTIHAESAQLHRDVYTLNASKNALELEYSDPGSKLCFGLKIIDGDRGREIALTHRDKTVRATLPWSTDTESWKYGFDH